MEKETNATPAEAKKTEKVEPDVTLIYPMNVHKVLDGFKAHQKRKSVNPGLDFPCAYGTSVRASHGGKVTIADPKNDGSGGRMVEVTHGDVKTQYLHLSSVAVKIGQVVKAGTVIGLAGGSGFDKDRHYGTHLHFALKIDGKNVDPVKYFKA